MKFKTSSGIKSIVGKDLITDRYVAIFELVKNSYDARSTEVIVSFNTSNDSEEGIGSLGNGKGKIYIVDNGIGMSKDDLDNKWLKLAYSDKQEGSSEENTDKDSLREIKNRVLVGSKGIGRFSSDSLGSVITIRTKVKYENIEHQLTVNWDDFDKDLKTLFEDVSVEYQENSSLSRIGVDSYTIIEISQLRDLWDEEQIDGVTEKLRRLKNPFIKDDNLDIYFGINIFKLNQKHSLNKSHLVFSNIAEVLKEKSINITASIELLKDESHKTTIILSDRGNLVYKIEKIDKSIFSQVDNIEISVNYLTTSAKSTFTRRMGIQPINYGNIFIYRNGFHVSPYGEEHYDIFGLNLRKTQGYNRYLATRELIGFISIKDSKNLFKETSSRNNGFIENGYFKALEEFYMTFIQRPLERYVQIINWGEIKDTGEEVYLTDTNIEENIKENFKKYISRDDFKVIKFNSEIDFEKNKPEKIIERIEEELTNPNPIKDNKKIEDDTKTLSKQFKNLEKERVEAKKIAEQEVKKNEALERQNKNLNAKRTEESYSQQISHHFKKFSSRLKSSVEDLEKIKSHIPQHEIFNFNDALRKISRTQYELTAFQELLTKTEIETRKGTLINWVEFFTWYFEEKESNRLQVTVNCELEHPYSEWEIPKTNAVEVIMMLENFYENALERDATILDIIFYQNKFTVISDSTPIPQNSINNIFDLGFSTKKNGTGIGLNQILKFLKKRGMEIKAENLNNFVQFTISRIKQ